MRLISPPLMPDHPHVRTPTRRRRAPRHRVGLRHTPGSRCTARPRAPSRADGGLAPCYASQHLPGKRDDGALSIAHRCVHAYCPRGAGRDHLRIPCCVAGGRTRSRCQCRNPSSEAPTRPVHAIPAPARRYRAPFLGRANHVRQRRQGSDSWQVHHLAECGARRTQFVELPLVE